MKEKIIAKRKIILLVLVTAIFIIIIFPKRTFADVGSFEDYDSGSSWSSGWDSDSSWDWGSSSSSSYDSDYSYGSDGSIFDILYFLGPNGIWVVIAIIIIFCVINAKHKHNKSNGDNIINTYYRPHISYNDAEVERKIKQIDQNFSKIEFESFAKEIFIKLQNAWTERDWEKIRPFESEELFAQHKAQLDGYIKNNQINVMERISVNDMHLVSFEQSGEKDILKVDLSSRMGDYIIDATTKKVIKGDKTKEYHHVYTLTFTRKTGITTISGKTGLNTTNCPNCGAPTTITSSGRCEYCNSVITTEDHGWVLSNLTRKY